MPEDDPEAVPAVCWRWPTCDEAIGENTCDWPDCPHPPTEGSPS